jgi:hypothetical protein
MHTFIMKEDNSFAVGIWLTTKEGPMFFDMFEARNFESAIRSVNILNGGNDVEKSFIVVMSLNGRFKITKEENILDNGNA